MARTFNLTAESVISKARSMINDTRTDMGLRQLDPEMLAALNDALNAMVGLHQGLFETDGAHTCAAGYLQTLENSRAVQLLDVVGLPEADLISLAQFRPGWTTEAQAAPKNWMRAAGDALRFMTYPPALAGEVLSVRFVKAPDTLTATSDLIPLPENYEPALVEYLAGRIEMKDDEHVESGRAQSLMDRFAANVKALAGG